MAVVRFKSLQEKTPKPKVDLQAQKNMQVLGSKPVKDPYSRVATQQETAKARTEWTQGKMNPIMSIKVS